MSSIIVNVKVCSSKGNWAEGYG